MLAGTEAVLRECVNVDIGLHVLDVDAYTASKPKPEQPDIFRMRYVETDGVAVGREVGFPRMVILEPDCRRRPLEVVTEEVTQNRPHQHVLVAMAFEAKARRTFAFIRRQQ